jgi:hypothetical protein
MLRPVLLHPAVAMDCRKFLALTFCCFLLYYQLSNSAPLSS